jgi:hypothetical protein
MLPHTVNSGIESALKEVLSDTAVAYIAVARVILYVIMTNVPYAHFSSNFAVKHRGYKTTVL